MDEEAVLDFVYEMGQLKDLPRTGWFRAGVSDPETVADHNLRAAQLAYLLAELEDHPNPERVCTMVVFHEIGEARVGDHDHVAKAYTEAAEAQAAADQLMDLAGAGQDLHELWREHEEQSTEAGVVARDADMLEAAITAREYEARGVEPARAWIEDTKQRVRTASAKRVLELLDEVEPSDWWARMDRPS
jgi:putative hydrolase of HD superfamily